METSVALNIPPLNAPHRELEWLPLADRDYQMAEVIPDYNRYNIHLINELKAKHLNGTDILGIWDSYLPIFNLPQVNVLPDLIHRCSANYDTKGLWYFGLQSFITHLFHHIATVNS